MAHEPTDRYHDQRLVVERTENGYKVIGLKEMTDEEKAEQAAQAANMLSLFKSSEIQGYKVFECGFYTFAEVFAFMEKVFKEPSRNPLA